MKLLNKLSYVQEQKLKCMLIMYFTAIINIVGIFTVVAIVIVLKNVIKSLI